MAQEFSANRVADRVAEIGEHPIIFFDGVCGLCNRFVDVVLQADTQGLFRFAPLQGESARELLKTLPEDPTRWSLAYLDEEGVHVESEAALLVCSRLGGWWWLPSLARFVPGPLRDSAYRAIARNRYRWFGRRDGCRIPTPSQRSRFLP